MPKKVKKPSPYLFALYDSKGELFNTYDTSLEAFNDAFGPRFRKRGKESFNVRTYALVLRKDEPKGVPVRAYLED